MIIVGATHGATAGVSRGRRPRPTPRRSSTPRTSSRSTARTRPGRRSRPPPRARRSSSTSATATAGRARTPTTRSTRRRTASGSTRRPGNGDSNNKYYGEPYVSTLDLAPNAVIILGHLCYASGNSEPGNAAPSRHRRPPARRQLRGRLPQGRRPAVIADGHGSPEPYIRALFTTHTTIEDVWRSAPNFHDHVKRVRLDPDAGRHRLHRHRQHHDRLLPLARRQAGPHHRRRHRRHVGRHRHRPGRRSSCPGNAAGRRRRRGALREPEPDPGRRAASRRPTVPAGTRLRRRQQHGRPPPSPGPRSTSRASTTRRSTAGSSPATSSRRTARAPHVWGVDGRRRPVLAQRRRRGRHGDDHRALLRDGRLDARRSRTPTARRSTTATGTGDDVQPHLGRHVRRRHPGRRRHVRRQRRRRGRLGQRVRARARASSRSTPSRPSSATVTPAARSGAVVQPERRRLAATPSP